MEKTALVLGASGRFGRNAAEQFRNAGWTVRTFDRSRDDLNAAAKGATVIVNAWNPLYPDWARMVPALHARVIDAARRSNATIIVPGNVYVFGPDTPVPWGAESPRNATNPLGKIRIEMEEAYRRSGVRTILLRAGDFIDTQASGNWFDQVMIKSLAKGIFTYPGQTDIQHAWAYLPDLCRAAVHLAERGDELPEFTEIAFPGYSVTGQQMADALDRITSRPIRLKRMSWLPLQLARPFWRMAGCLLEMRYLWQTPHWLDGREFDRFLPGFRHTPFDEALTAAIPAGSVKRQINPDQSVAAGA